MLFYIENLEKVAFDNEANPLVDLKQNFSG